MSISGAAKPLDLEPVHPNNVFVNDSHSTAPAPHALRLLIRKITIFSETYFVAMMKNKGVMRELWEEKRISPVVYK
jgi:hypothetical protein